MDEDKAVEEWVEEEGWAQVETVYAQNADTVYLMKGVCPVIR